MASKNPRTKNSGSTAADGAGAPTPQQQFDPKVKVTKSGKTIKRRWYHNVADGYRFTTQILPETKFWVWVPVIAVLLVFTLLTILTGRWILYPLLGLMTAFMVGLIMLSRKITQARYQQIDGQLGAAGVLLNEGRRGWSTRGEPVAVSPRTQDVVYRAVGRPGVVLISEGPKNRVSRLLGDERRKITRIMPEVPVHEVQIGEDEGQVHISKMWKAMSKQTGKLTPAEVATVAKRLDSMSGRNLPIPKGIDPTKARMSRRALRGR